MAGRAEAVSKLATRDPEVASGSHSEIVNFPYLGPSILKMDTVGVSTEWKHKIPLSMIAFMILVGSITIITCMPIL